jgi:hypothetical protein
MSPTPQPQHPKHEVISQTYTSANDSSPYLPSKQAGNQSPGLTKLVLVSADSHIERTERDSANLSNYNVSPEREQNMTSIFEQLNQKFQKTQEL